MSRRGIVARPRVAAALDRGWSTSLTLLAAPAGYGKSVAVESWANAAGHQVAWARLHDSDNDFVRLWSSIASAVERLRPGVGRDALLRLQGPTAHARPAIDALATALAADGRPLVIALDDLQAITDEHSLRSLDVSTDMLPPNTCLIAITRTLPRLRVARLRAQGRLTEIRSPLLAFTADEVKALFIAVDGLKLEDAAVEALTARTEGWPAALYLAALWLREQAAPETAIHALKGSRRYMHEFLTREVLADVDPATRHFLLETSVLGELSGALCDATLATTGSHDRLEALQESNLLVVPLTDQFGWYRYHSVLRDTLLAEFEARDATRARDLRERALAWSLEQDRVEAAAEYAAAAADWEALAQLIEAHQFRLLRTGRAATLARWTTALPRAALIEHPDALVAAVVAAHAVGQPAPQIRRLLALARSADADAAGAAAFQLVHAGHTEDIGEAVNLAAAAAALAEDDRNLRVAALAVLGITRLLAGDDEGAEDAAERALADPDAPERPLGLAIAASTMAILAAWHQRPWSAREYVDQALEISRAVSLTARPADPRALLADAIVANAEGRLGVAQRSAEAAARNTQQGELWRAWALLELAAIQLRRESVEAATVSLDRAAELLAVAIDPGRLTARVDELRSALTEQRETSDTPMMAPSPAELSVLRLLPGSTVREIGEALFLSPNTVKSHLRALYRKLGVSSRDDAVARAVALGLIDDPAS